MKKILLIAFVALSVSAFAAEKITKTTTIQNQTESTISSVNTVQTQGTVSLGDSFMSAFGMSNNEVQGGNSSSNSGSSLSSSSVAATVGVVSAAANAATANATNSTTIVTPYGKY